LSLFLVLREDVLKKGQRVAGVECQQRVRVLAIFSERPSSPDLHGLPEFELLVSSLQAKYPDHLGFVLAAQFRRFK